MSTGAAAKIGFGPEATFGTPVAPTFGLAAQATIKPNRGILRYAGPGIGNATQPGDPGRNSSAGGTSQTPVSPNMIGNLLRAACGPRTAFLAGTPNTHTFKPSATAFSATQARPSYTYHAERNSSKIHRFAGGQCNRIVFECNADERLTVATDWMFKTYATAVTATPALDSLTPFRYRHASHGIADAPAAVAAFNFFKNVRIEITNNIIGNTCQDGTDDYNAFFLGMIDVKVSGTICYNDNVLATKWQANTVQSVRLFWDNTINTPRTYLQVDVPKLRLDEVDDFQINSAGLLEQSFTGTAEYDATIANMIQFVLGNAQADSYT